MFCSRLRKSREPSCSTRQRRTFRESLRPKQPSTISPDRNRYKDYRISLTLYRSYIWEGAASTFSREKTVHFTITHWRTHPKQCTIQNASKQKIQRNFTAIWWPTVEQFRDRRGWLWWTPAPQHFINTVFNTVQVTQMPQQVLRLTPLMRRIITELEGNFPPAITQASECTWTLN